MLGSIDQLIVFTRSSNFKMYATISTNNIFKFNPVGTMDFFINRPHLKGWLLAVHNNLNPPKLHSIFLYANGVQVEGEKKNSIIPKLYYTLSSQKNMLK